MKSKIIIGILILQTLQIMPQTQGSIVYERRINLLKRFAKLEWMKEWLEEDKNMRTRTETFELFFNDTMAAFIPKESEKVEWMEWTTSKNKVYTFLHKKERITFKDIYGETFVLKDSLPKRKWKYTGKHRKIAGFDCIQMVWQENDSSRIYAYISTQIAAPVGPESFCGLPGAVLGLATEDGGIVYFAKSVSLSLPPEQKFKIPKFKKYTTTEELYNELNKEKKKSKWDKLTLELNFGGIN
jgi:GLPGLI family protein